MKIIVTEKITEDGLNYLKESGHEVDVKLALPREELLNIIENYDGIIVRSATKVNAELIERGKNLKVAGRAGNGIDNIDVDTCTRKGIVVVNTPEGNMMAVAELTLGLAFSMCRNIPQAYWGSKKKDFRRGQWVGFELDGRTVGIVGFGRIGAIVASKFKGCDMRVVAYDPYVTEEKFNKLGVEKCETLEDLLRQSDVITVHMPKTPETYGMIGEKEIAQCKKGAMLINVARGGLINEKALYSAMVEGRIAAAALDVLDPEPSYEKKPEEQDYTNPLLTLDNLVALPHLGASTVEASYNVGTDIAKLVADALNGKMVAAVNMPPMQVKDFSALRPYLELAEMLGGIYYQCEKELVRKIEVTYSGDLADKETKVITLSVIKGFLEPIIKETVNYVNAELILKNMGIELVESKRSQLDKYTNLITIKFFTKTRERSVSGTIFAKEEIRVVDFFGYKLDFEPTPFVIAIQNVDKPGIIGQIGTILGSSNINIAAMQWSRNRKGDKAVAFVSVDGEVGDEILELLKSIDGVLKASKLTF